ncbi:hypothetical protein KUCAC02_016466 [Chaenocephalus aceratus]|nr:hypothetical protein KUCAC02_016466 [Chaenocephalus aceratus]
MPRCFKSSKVWDHVTKLLLDTAKCNLCGNVINELNTSYKVPSRGEVSERFLPKMYEAALLNLKTELQEVEYAALTGDGLDI